MRAVWYDRTGPAREVLQIGVLPDPEPAPGEVRVRLHAAGVNPSDVKTRAGLRRPMAFPRMVPGQDGAGVIDAVGQGVDQNRIGQRVWVFNANWGRAFGTSAEMTCVPSDFAPDLPLEVSFDAGACFGVPVMTAHRCLFGGGGVAGLNVLVTGGAGVVGHYAIQLARWAGAARVVATVSSQAKATHAQDAGADFVIDYRREDVAGRIDAALGARAIHRIVDVDLHQNMATTVKILAPGGEIASYASMSETKPPLPFYELAELNAVVRPVLVYTLSVAARRLAVADIQRWAATQDARFAIAHRFPIEDVTAAHEAVEAGRKIGHVVLSLQPKL